MLLYLFLISAVILGAADTQQVVVLYTSEQNGYLEPCGCSQPQLGGLPRRYTLIKSLSGSNEDGNSEVDKKPVLILDNGDISRGFGRQEEIKADISLLALDEMGYHALNLGEKDIFLGIDYFRGAQQNVSFPFISANLLHRGEGRLFKPYLIESFRGIAHSQLRRLRYIYGGPGISIAIIGIVSKNFEDEIAGVGGELYIESPVKTLREILADLKLGNLHPESVLEQSRKELRAGVKESPQREKKKKQLHNPAETDVDAIILLAHTSVKEAKRLAELFPQISLIICGHGRDDPLFEPIKAGNTLIVNSGNRGKYVGKVVLTFDRNRRIIRKEHEVIELSGEIADSKAAVELLDYYQEILRSEDLLGKVQKERDRNGSFIGSQSCEDCHVAEFLVWKESKHAQAYETLVKVKRTYDPECVACHTTGFRYESGFRSFDKTPHLVGVGCEDCHGPGSLHVKDTEKGYGIIHREQPPASEKQSRKNDIPSEADSTRAIALRALLQTWENICVRCHNADRSPGFEFDKYWQRVKH